MKNLIFIVLLSFSFSCMNNPKVDQCLVNHDWCIPNCENSNMTWKFLTDGSFNVKTTVFGGRLHGCYQALFVWDKKCCFTIRYYLVRDTTQKNVELFFF